MSFVALVNGYPTCALLWFLLVAVALAVMLVLCGFRLCVMLSHLNCRILIHIGYIFPHALFHEGLSLYLGGILFNRKYNGTSK